MRDFDCGQYPAQTTAGRVLGHDPIQGKCLPPSQVAVGLPSPTRRWPDQSPRTSFLGARRAPPEMTVVRGVASAIRHREDRAGTHRPGQLDCLIDLLFSRAELLRTCEVGYRSRLAMEGEDEGQVH